MLHLALAALLAGSPVLGGPDDDNGKDKGKVYRADVEVVEQPAADEEDAIINDTYSFGRSERIPIKLWLGYGRGLVDEAYTTSGSEVDLPGQAEVIAQRAFVGAQLNVINFPAFSFGVGGQLVMANDKVEVTQLGQELESGFTLQNAKVYGMLRGSALGVHGGYIFDLGPEEEDIADDETGVSDQVDAWFVGLDFDYPSDRFRLFGGVDYINRDFGSITDGAIEDDELIVYNLGAGVRFAFVELGVASLWRTTLGINPLGAPTGGSHQISLAPYLILSPASFPVSLSVKGAVLSEYADYGYSVAGSGDFVTRNGFTVAATLGF